MGRRSLEFELRQLARRNRDGAFGTQADRRTILTRCARDLEDLGYRNLSARGLRAKHVDALVSRWQAQGLGVGTQKNRMAAVRWWAEKVGRTGAVAADNAHYGIGSRTFVTAESKATTVAEAQLAAVKDVHVRMSLRLQEAFGLRREEAMKIRPAAADRGDRLWVKSSWAKGGREREVPIRNAAQRQVLEDAKRLAGQGSLIPPTRLYVQQMRVYERWTGRVGIDRAHGLRHLYAQTRYEELTGWRSPAAGGPSREKLTIEQRDVDRAVRRQISRELGHEREQITAVYLGR